MWILLSLLSAFAFAAMWLLARASRGIPSSIVTAAQYLFGPLLLFLFLPGTTLPWNLPLWYLFLIFNGSIMAGASWGMIIASHKVPVTVSNPLLGLSSVASLITVFLFFHGTFTLWGVSGILLTTIGLFVLYRGRWTMWRTRYPWIVLAVVILYGINGSIMHALLDDFPHPMVLSGIFLTCNFLMPLAQAAKQSRSASWTGGTILLLTALALVTLTQDLATIFAFQLAPAPYVLSIKRLSVLLSVLGGYVLFHERDESLGRLLLSTVIVLAGVVMMTVG
ncbi:EamA family transporter [Candidatus Uhrbacteria bacterium]|nr:EamA family transporter [Candidatus Uhrbacteria bacterium]